MGVRALNLSSASHGFGERLGRVLGVGPSSMTKIRSEINSKALTRYWDLPDKKRLDLR